MEPGGAGAAVACGQRSVHWPPHRQSLRRRGARGEEVQPRVARTVSHQPESHARPRLAAADDGVRRWRGDHRGAVVREPRDCDGPADGGGVHVVYRRAPADVWPSKKALAGQRQSAAGSRGVRTDLRAPRYAHRGGRASLGQAVGTIRGPNRVSRRDVRLRGRPRAQHAARRVDDHQGRADGGDRRPERRRQDDAGQSVAAVL